MDTASWWWVVAGGLVAAELLSGGFLLLALAVAPLAGALASHAGLGLVGQYSAAALAGAGAVVAWGAWQRRQPRVDAQLSPDVQLDIGQTVNVPAWDARGQAQVHYRGVDWLAQRAALAPARSGPHRIVALHGSTLSLWPLDAADPTDTTVPTSPASPTDHADPAAVPHQPV